MCLGLCTGHDMQLKTELVAMFNINYEIFVNNEKYCVRGLCCNCVQLCIAEFIHSFIHIP